jgi:hypothetical protein
MAFGDSSITCIALQGVQCATTGDTTAIVVVSFNSAIEGI